MHKAKGEKNRTKILSDQMEARRAKNKVFLLNFVSCLLVYPISRAPVSVVLPAWLRSARASSQLNKRRLKSKDDVARFPHSLSFQPYTILHILKIDVCSGRSVFRLAVLHSLSIHT